MTDRIVIDTENSAETWWDALRSEHPDDPALGEVRSKLLRAACSGAYVQAPTDIADGFMAWAETLPGWEGGPTFAPHPIFLAPDDGDEDEDVGVA